VEIIPFRHEGLGNSAYLIDIGAGGAVLVDPGRAVDVYLAAARERGLRILAVLETHLHADFISGTSEIVAETGAMPFVPAKAAVRFPHRGVASGEHMSFGNVQVEAIASPGHAPEHLSYVARSRGAPPVLFSGGSLIVGGAARTDLINPGLTEELTREQYRTLHTAFLELPDETLLMPTHGSGSFCSVVEGTSGTSTLGEERRSNPLLRVRVEDEFVRWFPTTFPAAPSYFARMRPINQRGPRLRRDVALPPSLNPQQFDELRKRALVVDARPMDEFARGHVPGALSNPFRPAFGVWLGWLVPPDTPLAFVVDKANLTEVIEESMQVGHEDFAGWLEEGMEAWIAAGLPVSASEQIDPIRAKQAIESGALLIDVRERSEFARGHLPGAMNLPLGEIGARAGDVPRGVPLVAYCGRGERASSAASLLERAGLGPLLTLPGGAGAWKSAGYPVEHG
jgi:hydroxyacylglutathione hydrolase